ncbi:MAG TPA: glycoside hydrolase family 2, partial [Firmicutes bacterium]|nr:glycoside hydrolase family 2 [Bacillota bacterium]
MRVALNGKWHLYYFPEGQMNIQDPKTLRNAGFGPVEAQVPGNVELDLIRAGKLPEPFFGANIRKLRPYETYEWWYEREFDTPPQVEGRKVELVFHGVDCIATYWLNGEKLGESRNMFIEHRFDVTGKLRPQGRNHLVVRLGSPVNEARRHIYDPSMAAAPMNWEQLWIRKAPHSYGWDIMPRALSAGIWRPVELIVHDPDEITDLYFRTYRANDRMASIGIMFQIDTCEPISEGYALRFRGECRDSSFEREDSSLKCKDSTFEVTRPVFFNAGEIRFDISNPKLWWPRGYGEPHLYTVTTELLRHGEVIASRHDRIGIRVIELIRTDVTTAECPGEFLFKVNDTPILCKGSNWVPLDAFHSRDAERYRAALDLFRDLGCNIVRCWGGNVYEDHEFFDICDEYGILVWQDFAMACARYPQTPEFLDMIRAEATAVVRKLRNHPSLALWCGDNECDEVFTGAGLDPANNRITREVLPQVVYSCDPSRPYLPSSPYHSPEVVQRKDRRLMPEEHLWGPRDYYKSRFYIESTAHFVSEIGYHGCPNVSSIKKFISLDMLWPYQDNEEWRIHCTDPVPEGDSGYSYRVPLMANQIKEMFGEIPDNLEDFALASQISQAEAKKFFIEMTRLHKWRRTGIIWWNMLDGWPQFSDAIVDYYFGKKL